MDISSRQLLDALMISLTAIKNRVGETTLAQYFLAGTRENFIRDMLTHQLFNMGCVPMWEYKVVGEQVGKIDIAIMSAGRLDDIENIIELKVLHAKDISYRSGYHPYLKNIRTDFEKRSYLNLPHFAVVIFSNLQSKPEPKHKEQRLFGVFRA